MHLTCTKSCKILLKKTLIILALLWVKSTNSLKTFESEFAEFVTLNSSGDPVEASSILDRAEEHTIALGQISEKIPAIVAKLEDDFQISWMIWNRLPQVD